MVTRVIGLRNAMLSGQPYEYIGRPGIYGNMHPVGTHCPVKRCRRRIHTHGEAVNEFRLDFKLSIIGDDDYRAAVEQLRGKLLACPGNCKPGKPCHGDVYVEYLEGGAA